MSPSPTPEQAEALRRRVIEAAAERDRLVSEAMGAIQHQFWSQIATEIEAGYHGAQRDIAAALGVSRETVRSQLKKYA